LRARRAFSMLELIFVIVIMGIVGKYGTEFLAQSYSSYITTSINNRLLSQSESAIEFVASRLKYRIRDSIIAREAEVTTFDALSSLDSTKEYTVLEWVQKDIDGYRGTTKPYWSGIIDLDASDKDRLVSPETNTTEVNELIGLLSDENSSTLADSALYFIGSNSDINGYGWDGNIFTDQTKVMHPIKASSDEKSFAPSVGDFLNIDVYEYYQLSWSANALILKDSTLYFYYDYQPWKGELFYEDGKKSIVMENVSTFKAIEIGSTIKVQICVKSDMMEDYSVCKEKTIF